MHRLCLHIFLFGLAILGACFFYYENVLVLDVQNNILKNQRAVSKRAIGNLERFLENKRLSLASKAEVWSRSLALEKALMEKDEKKIFLVTEKLKKSLQDSYEIVRIYDFERSGFDSIEQTGAVKDLIPKALQGRTNAGWVLMEEGLSLMAVVPIGMKKDPTGVVVFGYTVSDDFLKAISLGDGDEWILIDKTKHGFSSFPYDSELVLSLVKMSLKSRIGKENKLLIKDGYSYALSHLRDNKGRWLGTFFVRSFVDSSYFEKIQNKAFLAYLLSLGLLLVSAVLLVYFFCKKTSSELSSYMEKLPANGKGKKPASLKKSVYESMERYALHTKLKIEEISSERKFYESLYFAAKIKDGELLLFHSMMEKEIKALGTLFDELCNANKDITMLADKCQGHIEALLDYKKLFNVALFGEDLLCLKKDLKAFKLSKKSLDKAKELRAMFLSVEEKFEKFSSFFAGRLRDDDENAVYPLDPYLSKLEKYMEAIAVSEGVKAFCLKIACDGIFLSLPKMTALLKALIGLSRFSLIVSLKSSENAEIFINISQKDNSCFVQFYDNGKGAEEADLRKCALFYNVKRPQEFDNLSLSSKHKILFDPLLADAILFKGEQHNVWGFYPLISLLESLSGSLVVSSGQESMVEFFLELPLEDTSDYRLEVSS